MIGFVPTDAGGWRVLREGPMAGCVHAEEHLYVLECAEDWAGTASAKWCRIWCGVCDRPVTPRRLMATAVDGPAL